MVYPIDKKLVIAIASSALFDLTESGKVFRDKGEEKYREYQRKHQKDILNKGVAFPFIKRFLNLNIAYPDKQLVEVVLLSKNDPDTGLRVFDSIKKYKLNITRGAFLTGKSPHEYIKAFNVSLFLSANSIDVKNAISAGHAAGTVLPSTVFDDANDHELRVAFDFDGVIADDEAESVYSPRKDLKAFRKHEEKKVDIPHNPGPLSELFKKLSFFQKLEHKKAKEDPDYKRVLRTAIVTTRDAPTHERLVMTLRNWGVLADETFFLGGIEKNRILKVLKPHIFFDDQMDHLKLTSKETPSVHIPFGIANKNKKK